MIEGCDDERQKTFKWATEAIGPQKGNFKKYFREDYIKWDPYYLAGLEMGLDGGMHLLIGEDTFSKIEWSRNDNSL